MEDVNNEMEFLWELTHIYFDISKKKKNEKRKLWGIIDLVWLQLDENGKPFENLQEPVPQGRHGIPLLTS